MMIPFDGFLNLWPPKTTWLMAARWSQGTMCRPTLASRGIVPFRQQMSQATNKSDWWFGTWLLFSIIYIYMGCHPSHWRTHFFSRWLKPPTNKCLWILSKLDLDHGQNGVLIQAITSNNFFWAMNWRDGEQEQRCWEEEMTLHCWHRG